MLVAVSIVNMKTQTEHCTACGKNLIIGFHLVSRYEDDHGNHIYHRACFDKFMIEEAERRAKIVEEDFQKSLEFKKQHGVRSYYLGPAVTNV